MAFTHLTLPPALAAVLLLCGSSSPCVATIVSASVSIQPAVSFSLPVRVSDVADLYGVQFDLSFSSLILELQSISEGPFLASTGESTLFIPGVIDNTSGTATITVDTLVGTVPGVTGSGNVAVFVFKGLTLGTSPITISNVILLNSDLNEIAASIQNGQVTIVPEPGTTVLFEGALLCCLVLAAAQGKYRLKPAGA